MTRPLRLRRAMGITQQAMAERLGISWRHYHRLEHGAPIAGTTDRLLTIYEEQHGLA
jgi:transcriptional regulator with XRE-family HTH domain